MKDVRAFERTCIAILLHQSAKLARDEESFKGPRHKEIKKYMRRKGGMNSGQVQIKYALEQAVVQSTKPGDYYLSPLPTPANNPCPYDTVESGINCTYVYPDRPAIDVDSRLRGLFRETVKLGLSTLPPTSSSGPRIPRGVPLRGVPPSVHRFRQSQRGDSLGIEVERIGSEWLGPCNPQTMSPFRDPERAIDTRLYMKDRGS